MAAAAARVILSVGQSIGAAAPGIKALAYLAAAWRSPQLFLQAAGWFRAGPPPQVGVRSGSVLFLFRASEEQIKQYRQDVEANKDKILKSLNKFLSDQFGDIFPPDDAICIVQEDDSILDHNFIFISEKPPQEDQAFWAAMYDYFNKYREHPQPPTVTKSYLHCKWIVNLLPRDIGFLPDRGEEERKRFPEKSASGSPKKAKSGHSDTRKITELVEAVITCAREFEKFAASSKAEKIIRSVKQQHESLNTRLSDLTDPDITIAFFGPNGVGKSAVINYMLVSKLDGPAMSAQSVRSVTTWPVIYAHGSKLSLSRVWLDISAAKQRLQRLRDADRDKTRYPATLEKELEQFFEGKPPTEISFEVRPGEDMWQRVAGETARNHHAEFISATTLALQYFVVTHPSFPKKQSYVDLPGYPDAEQEDLRKELIRSLFANTTVHVVFNFMHDTNRWKLTRADLTSLIDCGAFSDPNKIPMLVTVANPKNSGSRDLLLEQGGVRMLNNHLRIIISRAFDVSLPAVEVDVTVDDDSRRVIAEDAESLAPFASAAERLQLAETLLTCATAWIFLFPLPPMLDHKYDMKAQLEQVCQSARDHCRKRMCSTLIAPATLLITELLAHIKAASWHQEKAQKMELMDRIREKIQAGRGEIVVKVLTQFKEQAYSLDQCKNALKRMTDEYVELSRIALPLRSKAGDVRSG